MNMCPDCATPDLCRAANYDCGHERKPVKREAVDDPAHYAVQKLWHETCNDIRATEVEIAYNKLRLADDEAHLVTLERTRQQLEEHAEDHDWELTPPTEGKAS
jgi:hypothetical protein